MLWLRFSEGNLSQRPTLHLPCQDTHSLSDVYSGEVVPHKDLDPGDAEQKALHDGAQQFITGVVEHLTGNLVDEDVVGIENESPEERVGGIDSLTNYGIIPNTIRGSRRNDVSETRNKRWGIWWCLCCLI